MSGAAPPILPLGEAAWTVVLGDTVSPAVHHQVTALADRIRAAELAGVLEVVPAYAALTVFFDSGSGNAEVIRENIAELARGLADLPSSDLPVLPPSRLVTIPVRYDGPDLAYVAAATGLSQAEVIRRHAGVEYRVYLLGFVPGWAYLGDLDPTLVLPRRTVPRTRVPAGTVAIAGSQTGVYPLATPGGWHLIGSTPLKLFDPGRESAAMLQVGDRVRFQPAG